MLRTQLREILVVAAPLLLVFLTAQGSFASSDDDLDLLVSDDYSLHTDSAAYVIPLDRTNFDSMTSTGLWMVVFHAPWCGHCKTFLPVYNELAKKERHTLKCATVDCTEEGNKDICKRMEVAAYPTIKLMEKGHKVHTYEGSRALPDLQRFVSEYLQARSQWSRKKGSKPN